MALNYKFQRKKAARTLPVTTAYIPKEKKRRTPRRRSGGPNFDLYRQIAAYILLFLAILGLIALCTGSLGVTRIYRSLFCGLFGWGFYIVPFCLIYAAFVLGLFRNRPAAGKVVCTLLLPLLFGAFIHVAACQRTDLFQRGLGFAYGIKQLWLNGIETTEHCGGVASGLLAFILMRTVRKAIGGTLLVIAMILLLLKAVTGNLKNVLGTALTGVRYAFDKLGMRVQEATENAGERLAEIREKREADRAAYEAEKAAAAAEQADSSVSEHAARRFDQYDLDGLDDEEVDEDNIVPASEPEPDKDMTESFSPVSVPSEQPEDETDTADISAAEPSEEAEDPEETEETEPEIISAAEDTTEEITETTPVENSGAEPAADFAPAPAEVPETETEIAFVEDAEPAEAPVFTPAAAEEPEPEPMSIPLPDEEPVPVFNTFPVDEAENEAAPEDEVSADGAEAPAPTKAPEKKRTYNMDLFADFLADDDKPVPTQARETHQPKNRLPDPDPADIFGPPDIPDEDPFADFTIPTPKAPEARGFDLPQDNDKPQTAEEQTTAPQRSPFDVPLDEEPPQGWSSSARSPFDLLLDDDEPAAPAEPLRPTVVRDPFNENLLTVTLNIDPNAARSNSKPNVFDAEREDWKDDVFSGFDLDDD